MKELKSYLRLWIPFFLFSNAVWAYVFWEWYPGSWSQPSRMILCAMVSTIATIFLGWKASNQKENNEQELRIIEAQTKYIKAKTEYLEHPYWRTEDKVVDSLNILDEALRTGKEK